MFRNRVHPPTPPLDEVTAERLLRGAPLDDLPEVYRPLGQLLAHAAGPASPDELAGSTAAAAAFVAAHHVANAPRRRTRPVAVSVVTVLALAASTGTAVAATRGALPEPVQQVAHQALGAVGISVPGTEAHGSGDGEGGHSAPAVVNVGGGKVTSSATASTAPKRDVPPTTTVGPTSSPDTRDHETGVGSPNAADGVSGDNPNAGPGNNSGNATGNDSSQDQSGGGVTDPGGNLPSQSNGNGNGPPQVPPGQAKNPS